MRANPKYLNDPPEVIRQKFSDELGTITLYRGVAIPKSQFATLDSAINHLLVHGNWGKDLRPLTLSKKKKAINKYVSGRNNEGFTKLLRGRYSWDRGSFDAMISVSDHPEIARNIAYHQSNGGDKDNHILLMELNVPKIEVIQKQYLGYFWGYANDENPYMDGYMKPKFYFVEGTIVSNPPQSSSIEQFIPFYLNPSWISDVSVVQDYSWPELETF